MAQDSGLPLHPAYNQLVKFSYYLNMPGYKCKIVTASLVVSPFATEAAWIGCQRYVHKKRRLQSSHKSKQAGSVGCYCSIQKVLMERALVKPVCGKRYREAEGRLQKGAGSWVKPNPAMLFFSALERCVAPFPVRSLHPFLRCHCSKNKSANCHLLRHCHTKSKHLPPPEGKYQWKHLPAERVSPFGCIADWVATEAQQSMHWKTCLLLKELKPSKGTSAASLHTCEG